MADDLPTSVRYVKNGPSGRWWETAKKKNEVHAGWADVELAEHLLPQPNWKKIEVKLKAFYRRRSKSKSTQDKHRRVIKEKKDPKVASDLTALRCLLIQPKQYLWVTFQDGYMWWCTVRNGVKLNPERIQSKDQGYFWLKCARSWSNHSIDGSLLAIADLPGGVTKVAGFKGAICKPQEWERILRIIKDENDPGVAVMEGARTAYETAVAPLVQNLRPKDFELLVDLILSRSGWVRLASIGGATEGIDIEAENPATGEIVFVQIKSEASPAVLKDYVNRFRERRDRYHRMIFAVHSPKGKLIHPKDKYVQIWDVDRIAQLVVKLGLGGWLAKRV